MNELNSIADNNDLRCFMQDEILSRHRRPEVGGGGQSPQIFYTPDFERDGGLPLAKKLPVG